MATLLKTWVSIAHRRKLFIKLSPRNKLVLVLQLPKTELIKIRARKRPSHRGRQLDLNHSQTYSSRKRLIMSLFYVHALMQAYVSGCCITDTTSERHVFSTGKITSHSRHTSIKIAILRNMRLLITVSLDNYTSLPIIQVLLFKGLIISSFHG